LTDGHPFLERLDQGPILADGAMGTELYARGAQYGTCFEALNLSDPDLVQAVHLDYLKAGAEVIETNSFGGNRVRLGTYGLADQVQEINRKAARIARYARDTAGSTAFVAGSIGPMGAPLAPLGDLSEDQAREIYRQQMEALIEGGVDLFILETFYELNELCLAVQVAQEICDLPIVAQATFDEDGRTPRGQSVVKVAGALAELDVPVIGVNCSVGPQKVLEVAEQMMAACTANVSAMPNAGLPTQSAGRLIYVATPAYFGQMAQAMLEAGVKLIGGCCGTTPAHVAEMRVALDAYRQRAGVPVPQEACTPVTLPEPEVGEEAEPTSFAKKLAAGEFVTSIELSPPKGFKASALMARAGQLAESDVVDVVNITDSPMARVRMSALAACYMIQTQVGLETVLHFTTRDRNLMGLQSDLIGAHAMGVRNILALTGDPPSLGNFTEATGVFDVDSIGLARTINEMKQGHDLSGTDLGLPGGFCIGVAVDPTKPDLENEATRLRAKIEAGAEFIMTQPIYDLDMWHRFLEVYDAPIDVPVLLGILPLLSHKHAEFLHNEIPGITLSDQVRERMRQAGAEGRAEGIKLAQETLEQARDEFQGVYLMPSYNRCEIALAVLEALR